MFDGVALNYANLRLVHWCLQRQTTSEAAEHLRQNNTWSCAPRSSSRLVTIKPRCTNLVRRMGLRGVDFAHQVWDAPL